MALQQDENKKKPIASPLNNWMKSLGKSCRRLLVSQGLGRV